MDKKEIAKQIDIETRLIYIYTGVMILDAIDGYIKELENATIKANLYKHNFKRVLNKIKQSYEKHSKLLFSPQSMSKEVYNELTNALDKLDDEFNHDIKVFYLSLRQYLLNKIPDSDAVTCIARASVIRTLSEYSLINDKGMFDLLRKISGRPIGIHNEDMSMIHFYSGEYIRLFGSKYKDVDANLNDCQAAVKAFDIIDKKTQQIPKFIYER